MVSHNDAAEFVKSVSGDALLTGMQLSQIGSIGDERVEKFTLY
jgi:hypothetical protein